MDVPAGLMWPGAENPQLPPAKIKRRKRPNGCDPRFCTSYDGRSLHDSHNRLTVEPAQNCFFFDQLRSARAVALADAEGFHAVLRVIELIGQHLGRNISGLGGYKTKLSGLASASPLAADLPSQWPGYRIRRVV
jgi:hypothetical protein